jgi:hypothetical protein
MDKEYIYYFPKTDHFSVVPEDAHQRFAVWLISKHGSKVSDFWWEEKSREVIVEDLLSSFEKEIVFLGEL